MIERIDQRFPRGLGMLACLALLGSGCVTRVDGEEADEGTTGEITSSTGEDPAGTDAGSADSTGDEPVVTCELGVEASHPRVMVREQYENVVEDVLGLPREAWSSDTVWSALTPDWGDRAGPFEAVSIESPEEEAELAMGYAETAAVVAAAVDPQALLPCDASAPDQGACAEQLVTELGRLLWRRPLEPAEVQALLGHFEGVDLPTGTRGVVQALLASPQLWILQQTGTPWAEDPGVLVLDELSLATRMAFFLWNSTPDVALLAQAEAGALAQPQVRGAEVERMLADPRAERMLGQLHRAWLRVDDLDEVDKDASLFPSFGPALADAMEREIGLFVADVVLDGDARLETLLNAPFTYVDGELLALYGSDVVSDPGTLAPGEFARVDLDPQRRGGLLTLPAVMTRHSHSRELGFVYRGMLVREGLLCQPLPPPPPEVPDIPPIDPEANRYDLWAQLVSEQPECEGCHRLMDGPQFAFDEYDPIGRWQTEIDGTPVQTAGVLEDVAGGSFEIAGRAELTQRLAELPDVSVCVVRQHLRFALRRELDVADECAVELLVAQLEDSGASLRVLVREVALGEHFGLVRPM